MRKTLLIATLLGLGASFLAGTSAVAGGITVDAGLTPPEGRWILRAQMRSMSRQAPESMGEMSMDRVMVPLVVIHGATPALTLGLRQTIEFRTMAMNGMDDKASGFADLYIFAKYKVFRVNTRSYTLGISPVLGVKPPTGSEEISSNSWDLNTGLFVSGRADTWALDLNLGYSFRGFAGVAENSPKPGDELGLNLALARQIPVGATGNVALAPVLELTWTDTAANNSGGVEMPDSGETVFSLAPGLKCTIGDTIIEGLVRFPVTQDHKGMQLEAGIMFLLGVRRMF